MLSDIQLSTPGLLFSTVSLIMLAYTNRFVALATLIRSLKEKYSAKNDVLLLKQIYSLRNRAKIVKHAQLFCMAALLMSVVSMLCILAEQKVIAAYVFGISLLLLLVSLSVAAWEVYVSTKALSISLSELDDDIGNERKFSAGSGLKVLRNVLNS